MSSKLQEILNRNIEDWGDIPLSEFDSDVELLKQTIIKQQKQIEMLTPEKIELSDIDLMKKLNVTLDGEVITEDEWEKVRIFIRNLRSLK